MKKAILFASLFTMGIGAAKTRQAQVSVSINIGSQPSWGPVGYNYVQYYYIPAMDVYYYVPTHRYVYQEGGRWLFVPSLPARYKTYNVYTSYKVVINEPNAYLKHNVHVVQYKKYKMYTAKQVIIHDSKEPKYDVVNKNNKKNNKPGKNMMTTGTMEMTNMITNNKY